MANIYDRKTKTWVDVPDNEAQQLIAKGTHAFPQTYKIPVVAPDGELGTIPSEEAEAAFKEGFRMQTLEDRRVDQEIKQEANRQKHFGDSASGTAFLAGVMRGSTLGGSDVVLSSISPEVKEATAEIKERNPIESVAGEIAGVVGTTPFAGVGIVGQTATRAGQLARTGIEAASVGRELSTAGKIVRGLASHAGAGAAEGAIYGVGQGITESALGNPDELAENIMANAGMGALFGGALGASFKGAADAAPFVKHVAKSAYNTFDNLVGGAARKAVTSVYKPVVERMRGKEIANLVETLADSPEERSALADLLSNDPQAFAQAKKAAQAFESEFANAARKTAKDVEKSVRNIPKEQQEMVNHAISSAEGDISSALKSLSQSADDLAETARATTASMTGKATASGKLYDFADSALPKLKNSNNETVKSVYSAWQNILDSEISPMLRSSQNRARDIDSALSIGQEYSLLNKLKSAIPESVRTNKQVAELYNYVDSALKNHADEYIRETSRAIDNQVSAYAALKNAAGLGEGSSAVRRIVSDPVASRQFSALLDNISEFSPSIDAVKKGFKNASERQTTLEAAIQKMREFTEEGNRLTVDQMEYMLKQYAPSKGTAADKLERLRAAEQLIRETADMAPINKHLNIQRALGNETAQSMDELARLEPVYDAMSRLKVGGGSKSTVQDLMRKAFRYGAAGAVLGPSGAAAVAAGDAARSFAGNPARVMKTLTAIEKQARAAAKRMEKITNLAVDTLTKPEVRQGALVSLNSETERKTQDLDERRKTFKERRKMLADMQDFDQASHYLASRIPAMQGAPNVQMALNSQIAKTAQFLNSKLPDDPFADTSLMGQDTGWEPSDYELSTFERYVDAAENPMGVLSSIADGSVTPEEIETLQSLYPSLYNQLHERLVNGIVENGSKISYEQKLALSSLFDITADPSLSPDFVGSMQTNYAKEEQEQSATGRPPGRSIKIDLDPLNNVATETTRITNK